ncbi:MAG: hypothetical protein HQ525_03070 [Anaerolineae bacterium]|nr:hypothetical protein [Anaerolineae bacterium]
MKKINKIVQILCALIFLSACSSQQVEDPGLVFTIVASTQTAAAYQTWEPFSLITNTPTPAILRPTITLQPTNTVYVFVPTSTNTPTPTPSATPKPIKLTKWPDWRTGSVISMPRGTGLNIGTNKMFSILKGVKVKVIRKNGVKLRSAPNKAIGGPMELRNSILTLTGVMNRNKDYGWFFAQVIAPGGNKYWVGGSDGDENTNPIESLEFYYPIETPVPTLEISPTPSLIPSPTPYWILPSTPTLTPTSIP